MLRISCVFIVLMVASGHADAELEVDLHEKISQLESKVNMLTQRIQQDEELSRQCRSQEDKTMSSLQSQIYNLKWQLGNVTALENNNSRAIRDVIGTVHRWSKNEIFKSNSRFARSSDPTEVAFTAMLHHVLNDIPVHTTVIFDKLVYWSGASGDEYDVSTGVFTCPTSGLYLFSVFIESNTVDTEANVRLMKEGTSYMFVISEKSVEAEDDTGGNVCLVTVNKGDRVWVETIHNDKQSLWPSFTTFSGVLIHRHYE